MSKAIIPTPSLSSPDYTLHLLGHCSFLWMLKFKTRYALCHSALHVFRQRARRIERSAPFANHDTHKTSTCTEEARVIS